MNRTYRLFGTSTSQLKEMSFWFVAIEDKSIEEAWTLLGDFSGIKNVANYVARIGLYFSTSRQTAVKRFKKNIFILLFFNRFHFDMLINCHQVCNSLQQ